MSLDRFLQVCYELIPLEVAGGVACDVVPQLVLGKREMDPLVSEDNDIPRESSESVEQVDCRGLPHRIQQDLLREGWPPDDFQSFLDLPNEVLGFVKVEASAIQFGEESSVIPNSDLIPCDACHLSHPQPF